MKPAFFRSVLCFESGWWCKKVKRVTIGKVTEGQTRMCGIVGYTGNKEAQPLLFKALERLEYRGYDSFGIAVLGESLGVYKDTGRVKALAKSAPTLTGSIGIGHTRWATHGEPSQLNAHPHTDCSGRFAVVHNAVITNYQYLKEELVREGHHFVSETDTEVIPHLIEKYYQGSLEPAVAKALTKLKGSYAIAVIARADLVREGYLNRTTALGRLQQEEDPHTVAIVKEKLATSGGSLGK